MILLFVTRKNVIHKVHMFYVLREIIFIVSLLEKLLIFNIIGSKLIWQLSFHISSKEQERLIFVNVLFSIFSFAW